MSRPSKNTDKLLIQAGRRLLPETGVSGLSLRRVAQEAGVNLGMFHYHFKTKRKFALLVLQEIYEEFFKNFSVETGKDVPPLERLRCALITLSKFARDNRRLFLMIFRDVLDENAEAAGFARANIPRHLLIIAGLVRDCQKQGLIKKMPLPSAIAFLAGSSVAPNIVMGVIEQALLRRPFGLAVKLVAPMLASDSAIAERVDLALKALRGDK